MKENKYKYESPDERTERFMRLVEADKERRLKEEYKAERRKDKLKGELYDIFGSKRNS